MIIKYNNNLVHVSTRTKVKEPLGGLQYSIQNMTLRLLFLRDRSYEWNNESDGCTVIYDTVPVLYLYFIQYGLI